MLIDEWIIMINMIIKIKNLTAQQNISKDSFGILK
jgi:hypothetical protein